MKKLIAVALIGIVSITSLAFAGTNPATISSMRKTVLNHKYEQLTKIEQHQAQVSSSDKTATTKNTI